MLNAVREQGVEGVVAKRKNSLYEAGHRTGAWAKYRVNRGQELVIGGYTPSPHGLDSIIVGYYHGNDLIYVARVRNGLVPASRRRILERLRSLVTPKCPFVNLPETRQSRWGEGLTAEDLKKCVWRFGPRLSLRSNSRNGLRVIIFLRLLSAHTSLQMVRKLPEPF